MVRDRAFYRDFFAMWIVLVLQNVITLSFLNSLSDLIHIELSMNPLFSAIIKTSSYS